MATSQIYRHLTIEDRRIIKPGIREGLTKISKAAMLRKDRTTIGKEIPKHTTPLYLTGREMNDLKVYSEDNPETKVVEMDTVYNDISTDLFIQTFEFKNEAYFFFAIYLENLSAKGMAKGLDFLKKILTPARFESISMSFSLTEGLNLQRPTRLKTPGMVLISAGCFSVIP